MQAHTAMVSLKPREMPLVEAKFDFIARQLNPDRQARRLTRVLELVDLPDLAADGMATRTNVERLLELRGTPECAAFRDWLWSADDVSDAEIQDRFTALRARLGAFAHTTTGKAIRWAIGTGAGLIPGAGFVLGPVAGALDSFVAEKVLPDRGPLTFLGDQYPSLFNGR
jgi:hypothetical protein